MILKKRVLGENAIKSTNEKGTLEGRRKIFFSETRVRREKNSVAKIHISQKCSCRKPIYYPSPPLSFSLVESKRVLSIFGNPGPNRVLNT